MQQGFLSDVEVADRVLTHIRDKTTDRGTNVWQEPVSNYLSEDLFRKELDVFKRMPTVICPSAALIDVGSYVTAEVAGIPLIFVRGKDRKIRAFKNACRHRGTQLVDGSGCTQAFVCPYHGWAYRLDGVLQTIPHEDGFPGVCKSELGLAEIAAEERYGLIFVSFQDDGMELSDIGFLEHVIGEDQQVLTTNTSIIDANWKIHLESFLEGYHIKYAHPETFFPFGYDNLNLVEFCGRNARVTFPFRRIEKLSSLPKKEWSVAGNLTYVYHIFPNALVTVLSHHTNLVVLEPLNIGQTRSTIYRFANASAGADALERAKRDASFVADTGVTEDLAVVTGIQRSVNSGANSHFVFGHFEEAIVRFHKNLDRLLAAAA